VLLGAGALALTAVTAGGWWRLYRHRPAHDGGVLSVQEAHRQARAGDVLLVDIRTAGEWRRTGVPEGAVPLDMRRADFTEALAALVNGETGRPIALICARGVRSARVSKRLIEAGFANVLDVPEGMFGSAAGPGWLNSRLPVTGWRG